jgi:hypothetical protein
VMRGMKRLSLQGGGTGGPRHWGLFGLGARIVHFISKES